MRKETINKYYEMGKEMNKKYMGNLNMCIYSEDCDFMSDVFLSELFDFGWNGLECPVRCEGWRYNEKPDGNRSRNFRDQKMEVGVSMMMVVTENGETEECKDKSYEIFNGGEKFNYKGWLLPVKGTDGEPLIWIDNNF